MDWNAYSFVMRSSHRTEILKCMTTPMVPSQIAKATGMYSSYVSHTLADFIKQDIAECANPEAKRWRVYVLTELGKEIQKHIDELPEKYVK